MRAALLQICSGDDPDANLAMVRNMVQKAAAGGAEFILTPEVTNCVSTSRSHQQSVLVLEEDDPMLAALQQQAKALGVWVLIGSLALKTRDADGRFANRSFLIDPQGRIQARYDKIHMFDVDIGENDRFRESDGYRPGDRAVVAQAGFASIGMTICYDLRFAHLYRALAQAGAQILTVPAAFHPVTGAAHWQALLQARAIETGCFILAPAQTGDHNISQGKPRKSFGHSMVFSPWGKIIARSDDTVGIVFVDLDLAEVAQARERVPSLFHDRQFKAP